MDKLIRISKWFVIAFVALLAVRSAMVDNVGLGKVGVRRSNLGGLTERDLGPGWRLEVAGIHKIIELPSTYQFLDFNDKEALEIRTRDNNTVTVDISVPYRITTGSAHLIVKEGTHAEDGSGGFRYQRLARDTTVGVLRQHLAELQTSDFYNTKRREEVSDRVLAVLNEELASLHVEAGAILVRAVYFRPEYETQLLQIQLNEQNKLLDGARTQVADMQQKLDNYQQRTKALAASEAQEKIAELAQLDRAYQVGFLPAPEGVIPADEAALSPEAFAAYNAPGAGRRRLVELDEDQRADLLAKVAETLGGTAADYEKSLDSYLLGIKTIQAESLAYDQQVRARADGVAARLAADGAAQVAEVRGNYEARINELFDSPAGRAYVAWQAAANIKFAETLTFNSSDGIPSVLHLRDFARAFMGN
jgi:regulator of protease activity HflC (stomatin/prohibitin superfamily)